MTRRWRGLLRMGAVLFALAVLLVLPRQGFAETIEIVNKTTGTIVVQAAAVVKGAVRRGTPTTLAPGDKMTITVPGNKLINVYDARLPNRMLYQGTIPGSPTDGSYVIRQPDPRIPKLSLDVNRPGVMGR